MKRNLAYTLVLLLILAIVVGIYGFATRTYYFGGTVKSVNGSTLVVVGHLTTKSGLPLGNRVEPLTLNIDINSETTLKRIAIHIPTNVDSFNVQDLKKDETTTTLEVVKEDLQGSHSIGVEATLKKKGESYIGREIYFRVPVFE